LTIQPEITTEEAKDIVSTKLAPRVTEADLLASIKHVRYYRDDFTTIAVLTLKNGFKVVGHSTPASEANFDTAVGQRYAWDNAFRQMWQLEGYALKTRLSNE
jgi:hypothetical protein